MQSNARIQCWACNRVGSKHNRARDGWERRAVRPAGSPGAILVWICRRCDLKFWEIGPRPTVKGAWADKKTDRHDARAIARP